jgi:hypothetical protein
MDIDLLFTPSGEAGLICSENLVKKAVGLVLDTQNGVLTLEFNDMDYLEMNIPVESEYFQTLDYCTQIHIGAVKNEHIAQAYQIPFVFLDDPYRSEMMGRLKQPDNPLQAFNYFLKNCVSGQPVHRDDLGDDTKAGCILGDAVPSSLQFAPHLARRHAMEVAPKAAPSAPGPSGPGLGGSGGARTGGYIQRRNSDRDTD